MIVLFLTGPFVICAIICFLQVFIHETGHYLKIRQWAKILNWDITGTVVYIGDEDSRELCKIGAYRIMSKGKMKTGIISSPVYKKLALYKGKEKYAIIRENTAAGAVSILYTGFALLCTLQVVAIFNANLFKPTDLIFYLPFTILAAVFIVFTYKNSFGAGGENSDLYFWRNPDKFVDYFKEDMEELILWDT